MAIHRIGLIGYDEINPLDLAGPMEVFDTANSRRGAQFYRQSVISAEGGAFRSSNGLVMQAHFALDAAPPFDTVIVPGGAGLRDPKICEPIAHWLQRRAPRLKRIASVCTGVYALGAAGLLDGRRVTTHWRFAGDVAARFPNAKVEADAIFLNDGNIYSSAGVTTGIDLALSLVEQDLGEAVALGVARELVVYVKRSGGQMQFSEPLRFQMKAQDRFSKLADWILGNLDGDLSVECMAGRVSLGPRQFSRRFKARFGMSPAEYVEMLRLDEARRRLAEASTNVEMVAGSIGYASADAFRRAFERRFGLPPSIYRRQFRPVLADS